MAKFLISAFADEAGNSLEEQVSALCDHGISYIEPRSFDKRGILEIPEEELHHIREVLDAHNIKVGSLGSPIGKFQITEDFDKQLVEFEKALRACEILGTNKMRMFSFYYEGLNIASCRDEVIRRLTIMCDLAESRGVTLCHENEARIYGEYPEQVLDLLTNIPKLHGIMDPANYRLADANIEDGINATLTRFAYMHIKDAIYSTQTIVPSGEGEGKIGYLIDKINDNVEGPVYLTLEPHLHVFGAYNQIDKRELKGVHIYKNNRESFKASHDALVKVLKEHGYTRNENNEWTK